MEEPDLRVKSLTGCPDEVLLAIAEISTLECWKTQEMRKETLSTPELIRRGFILERHLRIDCEPACSREPEIRPDSAMADNPSSTLAGATSPADVTLELMAKIFRETAVLYLHTVLSGSNPGACRSMDATWRHTLNVHRGTRDHSDRGCHHPSVPSVAGLSPRPGPRISILFSGLLDRRPRPQGGTQV